jgi:hypothetical protein
MNGIQSVFKGIPQIDNAMCGLGVWESYLLLNHHLIHTSTRNNEVAVRLRDMIPDCHCDG